MKRIGPAMLRAYALVVEFPASSKGFIAGEMEFSYGTSRTKGYEVINRCIKAGMMEYREEDRELFPLPWGQR